MQYRAAVIAKLGVNRINVLAEWTLIVGHGTCWGVRTA